MRFSPTHCRERKARAEVSVCAGEAAGGAAAARALRRAHHAGDALVPPCLERAKRKEEGRECVRARARGRAAGRLRARRTLDDLALAQREAEGVAAVARAIELGPVLVQRARVCGKQGREAKEHECAARRCAAAAQCDGGSGARACVRLLLAQRDAQCMESLSPFEANLSHTAGLNLTPMRSESFGGRSTLSAAETTAAPPTTAAASAPRSENFIFVCGSCVGARRWEAGEVRPWPARASRPAGRTRACHFSRHVAFPAQHTSLNVAVWKCD